ncbi:MAG: sarcosine oxidase subunit gamma [Francisellaceae bacterium]
MWINHYRQITIRGDQHQTLFRNNIAETLNLALPRSVGKSTQNNDGRLMCLGPDEWLYVGFNADNKTYGHLWQMKSALIKQDITTAIVDVSNARSVLKFNGVSTILNGFCPLNFDESAFPIACVAQSHLGHAGVIFYRLDSMTFELHVLNSMTDYIDHLLSEIMR